MHSDPLSDMLIRLKNASAVRKVSVAVPKSKMNQAVLKLMLEENYVADVQEDNSGKFPLLVVKLKYMGGSGAIQHVKRISKPGVRIYSRSGDIKKTLSGYGLKIISTSKGIMTDSLARKNKLGGEVLAELW